jgi:hypothetical protein
MARAREEVLMPGWLGSFKGRRPIADQFAFNPYKCPSNWRQLCCYKGGGGRCQSGRLNRAPQPFVSLQCIAVAATNPRSLLAPALSNGGHVPRLHHTELSRASCTKRLASGSCTVRCCTVRALVANETLDPSMIHGAAKNQVTWLETRSKLGGTDWCFVFNLTDDATVQCHPRTPHPSENEQSK